jgi:pyrroline-5-carboxylate reductase
MAVPNNVAVIGGGNLGNSIARGLISAGLNPTSSLAVTRRRPELLAELAEAGVATGDDNLAAIRSADIVVLCVQPQQLDGVMEEIAGELDPVRRAQLGDEIPIIRAMPNIGIAIGESMTCLAADAVSESSVPMARELFGSLGATMLIQEEQMVPATALCACGIAFFLRAIRAASQGGIEIGFHAEEAIFLAAQTARGAASLLLEHGNHPETEIDKVTTPKGCTIYGLNEMENRGFSSAMIRGIITAAEKAGGLYQGGDGN